MGGKEIAAYDGVDDRLFGIALHNGGEPLLRDRRAEAAAHDFRHHGVLRTAGDDGTLIQAGADGQGVGRPAQGLQNLLFAEYHPGMGVGAVHAGGAGQLQTGLKEAVCQIIVCNNSLVPVIFQVVLFNQAPDGFGNQLVEFLFLHYGAVVHAVQDREQSGM